MKDSLETRLGMFFALALIGITIILEIIGSFESLKPGLILQARFNNILELKEGDPVKLGGKQIGFVQQIRLSDQKVLVLLKITDTHAPIRTDSKATIKYSGLLGRNYVLIDFGSPTSPLVTTGTELQSIEQPDLNQIMSKLDNVASGIERLTQNISDIDFEELLTPFTDFMKESGPRFTQIITNLADISTQIRSGNGTVGRLIYEDDLYRQATNAVSDLEKLAQQLTGFVDQIHQTLEDIRSGKGTLGKLTTDETLYVELSKAATQAREILEKINRGEGTIGKVVNDPSLVEEAKLTLRKIDQATDTMQDQGVLSVINLLLSPLF